MDLLRRRDYKGPVSSIGSLAIVGTTKSWLALEDVDRGLTKTMQLSQIMAEKVNGKTAIPTGRYEVTINFSERFQRPMPLLLDVPGFAGVRIHSGNTDVDTDGCLLLGTVKVNDDFIGNSRQAFAEFFPLLKQAIDNGEKAFITIQ